MRMIKDAHYGKRDGKFKYWSYRIVTDDGQLIGTRTSRNLYFGAVVTEGPNGGGILCFTSTRNYLEDRAHFWAKFNAENWRGDHSIWIHTVTEEGSQPKYHIHAYAGKGN